MRHIGALLGITVLVFGTIFLLTSDWPFGEPLEEAPSAGEATMVASETAGPPAEPSAEPAPADEPEPVESAQPVGSAAPEEAAAAAQPEPEDEAPAEQQATADPAPEPLQTAQAADADAPMEPLPAPEQPATTPLTPIQSQSEPAAQQADPATAGAPATTASDLEPLFSQGEEQFAMSCQACHGGSGEGGVGPALAGNENLADAAHVLETIINGTEMMPPFGGQLDDEAIAAVATYIRNAWGNQFGPVDPQDAAAAR